MFNSKARALQMATMKTFSVAGISTLPSGQTKIRFAKDFVDRFKVLAKNGHSDIRLIELGGEFTKAEIAKILINHPQFQDEAAQSAITDYVTRNAKDIAAEVGATQAEKESEEVEAEAAPELDDAPF
jgi:hypothetical protein